MSSYGVIFLGQNPATGQHEYGLGMYCSVEVPKDLRDLNDDTHSIYPCLVTDEHGIPQISPSSFSIRRAAMVLNLAAD